MTGSIRLAGVLGVAAMWVISIRQPAHAQALMRGDFTVGAQVSGGFMPNPFSRGLGVTGEATYSFTDRFYLSGSGGRYSGSYRDSGLGANASQTLQFADAALGVQFRLQHSLSPFVDAGLSGAWGDGSERYETSFNQLEPALNFWRIALRTGGGMRYVRKAHSRWGFTATYHVYFPVRTHESLSDPLLSLRSERIHDRAGAGFFFRF